MGKVMQITQGLTKPFSLGNGGFGKLLDPREHAKAAAGLVNTVTGGLLGGNQPQQQQQAPVQAQAQAPVTAVAPNVGVPEKEGAEEESASSKRKVRSRGKKNLTVSRESGKGVNL